MKRLFSVSGTIEYVARFVLELFPFSSMVHRYGITAVAAGKNVVKTHDADHGSGHISSVRGSDPVLYVHAA